MSAATSHFWDDDAGGTECPRSLSPIPSDVPDSYTRARCPHCGHRVRVSGGRFETHFPRLAGSSVSVGLCPTAGESQLSQGAS